MNVVSLDVGEWVASRIPGCERGFSNYKSLAVIDKEIIAGVVFHNWNPESGVIEISSAADSPKWLQRGVMEEVLEYPFEQLECQMVVARMSEKNKRARRLWRALGANEYIIPRLRGRDENEALLTLTDEDWSASKFRNSPNGKT